MFFSLKQKIAFYSKVAQKNSKKADGTPYTESYRERARGFLDACKEHSRIYYSKSNYIRHSNNDSKMQAKKTYEMGKQLNLFGSNSNTNIPKRIGTNFNKLNEKDLNEFDEIIKIWGK